MLPSRKLTICSINHVTAESLEQRQLKAEVDGGTSGGMEDRIVRLEKSVEKIGDQLVTVREDIATIKENIRHLPTKPWLFTTLATMVTSMIVLLTFIMAALVRFLPHAN